MRGLTVYRRQLRGGPSETYYCRFRARDKGGVLRRHQLDTGCREYRAAVRWARAQRDAMVGGRKNMVFAARLAQDRPGVPTVGQLLDAWRRNQHSCNEKTAAETVSRFRMVWREALCLPDNAALDAASTSRLTRTALLDWIAARQGLPRPDFRLARPQNNTLRARLREVRSILSARRDHVWMDAGLAVPDFAWVAAVPMPQATERPYHALDSVTMARMEAAVDAHPDENVRRAFWMMRLLAMRNSEVSACRIGWAEHLAGQRVLRIAQRPNEGFTLKRAGGGRLLVLPDRLQAWFEGPADAYLLAGGASERKSEVWRRLSALLRPFLPGRTKSCYELRKQRITEEMIATGSMAAAAALAGDLVATVEKHYCDIAANLPALRAAL